MSLTISSSFDAGNIRVTRQDGDSADLEIVTDHLSDFYQWFYFRVKNMVAGVKYKFNIINLEKKVSAFAKGMRPVIHAKPERHKKHRLVRKLYRQRYLVEVFFHNLKRFRAIATRYEKTARNFLALVQVACAWLWLEN